MADFTLPAYLRKLLPAEGSKGRLRFSQGQATELRRMQDARALPALGPLVRGSWWLLFLKDPSPRARGRVHRTYNHLFALQARLRRNLQDVYCMDCCIRATWHPTGYADDHFAVCPSCGDIRRLMAATSGLIGTLGEAPYDDPDALYVRLWDPQRRRGENLDLELTRVEAHPGLGEDLDLALATVVNSLHNHHNPVPPISLHTDEPLQENTRRLIEPYLAR